MSPASTAYVEFLDIGRFGSGAYDAFLKDFLENKYQDKQVAVVAAIGSGALELLLRNRPKFLSAVPVVYTLFDPAEGARFSRLANATGTIVPLSFRTFVVSARAVVPGLKRIVHVGDPFERQAYRHHFTKEMEELSKELEFVDLSGLPLPIIKAWVAALPDDAAIAYTAMYEDDAGTHYDIHEVLRSLVEAANRPIVFDNATFVGRGGAGGFVPEPEDIGRESARLALRILGGEAAASIPIETRDLLKPVFDARQLKRWNVSESRLPPGSEVRFRERSAWEVYHWQIAAILAAFVFLSSLVAWLLVERNRRRSAETEAHRCLVEAVQMNRALTMGTMSASLAHEINQPLAAMLANTEAAEIMLASVEPNLGEIKQILAEIRVDNCRASDIIEHLRKLLKTGEIEHQDIDLNELVADAIRMLKPEAERRGIGLVFDGASDVAECRGDPVHLQQVMFNLAINGMDAMRDSARERRMTVRVDSSDPAQLVVAVMDTGTGIPKDMLKAIFEPMITTKRHGTGLGLSIARSIVEAHGGMIWAENRDGGGAAFHFTLPRGGSAAAIRQSVEYCPEVQ